MEKGLVTKAAQDAFLKDVQEWTKGQKAWVRVGITLGCKALFIVADDKYADKLPQDLKQKSQLFFDAVLVQKDVESALTLGIELIPIILDLIKKDKPALPNG